MSSLNDSAWLLCDIAWLQDDYVTAAVNVLACVLTLQSWLLYWLKLLCETSQAPILSLSCHQVKLMLWCFISNIYTYFLPSSFVAWPFQYNLIIWSVLLVDQERPGGFSPLFSHFIGVLFMQQVYLGFRNLTNFIHNVFKNHGFPSDWVAEYL